MSGAFRNLKNTPVRGGSTLGQVAAQVDAGPVGYKVAPFLSKIKGKAAGSRILLTGTSIASFDVSPVQIIGRLLQRAYGSNETQTINLGQHGGTFGPSGGRKKQVYGGPGYFRMALEPGNADVTYSGYVDALRLVYGKEADGGAFDVWIDGVFDSTLTSNGAQAYEQVYAKAFAAPGFHTITIKAPAAGWAYLERVELVRNGAGVFIESATLGGSGLWNTRGLMADANAVTNKAGIPIVGNNGVDAHSARVAATAPDLVICQHFTNDTGTPVDFEAALARLVANTGAAGIPLVLLSEQPALGYVAAAGGALTAAPQRILDAILSYRGERHVTVIDWTEMVDFRDKTAYEAKYFPGVDKTHPASDGQALPMQALCELFDVPHPARDSALGAQLENSLSVGGLIVPEPADDPYAVRVGAVGAVLSVQGDGIHGKRRQIVGRSRNMASGHYAAAYFAEDVPSLVPTADTAAIAASATVDASGPYLRLAANTPICSVATHRAASVEQEVTLVLLAKWTGASVPQLKLNTPSTNAVPRVTVNGVAYGNVTGEVIAPMLLPTDSPVLVHLSWKHNAASNPMVAFSVAGSNMDVYGVWATEGTVPLITPRRLDRYRQIGFPLYMTGDAVPANVVPGQTYLESINGATVEKVALDAVCWKPLQGVFARVYELRNKGALFCQRISPNAPATLAYRDKLGGEAYDSAGAPPWQLNGAFGAFPTGKRFTLGFRCPSSANTGVGVQVAFFNGGNNNWTYLRADGTWAVQVGGNQTTQPILAIGNNFADGLNVALTFDMPDASFAAALGGGPALLVSFFQAGSKYFAPMVLAEGSSAVASWTA